MSKHIKTMPVRNHKLHIRKKVNIQTYNAIFPIYLLQLFDYLLSSIWTSIIHYNDFKLYVPDPKAQKFYKTIATCDNIYQYR